MANTKLVFKRIAAGTSIAAAGALALPGVASAADLPVTFTATDNGNCTATFTITNTTSSDMNKVVYWTGQDIPEVAPPFGEDDGSAVALTSTVEAGKDTWLVDGVYAKGYAATTTTADVDFSSVSVDGNDVEVAYRMTGLETDDYDTALKNVTVTGCDVPLGTGSLTDLFGSFFS